MSKWWILLFTFFINYGGITRTVWASRLQEYSFWFLLRAPPVNHNVRRMLMVEPGATRAYQGHSGTCYAYRWLGGRNRMSNLGRFESAWTDSVGKMESQGSICISFGSSGWTDSFGKMENQGLLSLVQLAVQIRSKSAQNGKSGFHLP